MDSYRLDLLLDELTSAAVPVTSVAHVRGEHPVSGRAWFYQGPHGWVRLDLSRALTSDEQASAQMLIDQHKPDQKTTAEQLRLDLLTRAQQAQTVEQLRQVVVDLISAYLT